MIGGQSGFTKAKSTAAALGPLLAQIAGSTAGCWPVQLEKRPPALLQALEHWRSCVCCCSRARALHAGETGWRALERRRMQHNEGRPHRSGRAIPRTYVDSSFQKWDCAPRRPVGSWALASVSRAEATTPLAAHACTLAPAVLCSVSALSGRGASSSGTGHFASICSAETTTNLAPSTTPPASPSPFVPSRALRPSF